jgi:hypothetical protein
MKNPATHGSKSPGLALIEIQKGELNIKVSEPPHFQIPQLAAPTGEVEARTVQGLD